MKDIHNVKRSTPSTDSSLLMDLLHDMKKVPGACVEIVKDDESDIVRGIYFQEGIMRHIFEKYPELLLIDAAYKLNNLRMPFFVLMAVDGNDSTADDTFSADILPEPIGTLKLPPKMKRRGRPKGTEVTVVGLIRGRYCSGRPLPFLKVKMSPREKEKEMPSWIVPNSMVNIAVATECQLNIDSIKLTKDIPYKIFDENVNIERIKKYFTKDAWKYLKDLLRQKKESECWVCSVCTEDLQM